MVWSSFVQRTYDQLSQDLAINRNPAVILVSGAGISGGDVNSSGMFDIPLISNIPEYCLSGAGHQRRNIWQCWRGELSKTEHPVVIRVPSTVVYAGKRRITIMDS